MPRTLVAIGVVAVFVLGAGAYLLREPDRAVVVPAVAPAAPPAAPPGARPAVPPVAAVPSPAPAASVPASVAPSFDVVRVNPQGAAVIAGRAAPGSEVVVLDGSREIARTQADRQGSFVAVPTAPLEPGGRSLTLASRTETAGPVRSDGAVMVVVPPPPIVLPASPPSNAPPAPAPLAVLVPRAGAPVVLQPDRTAGPVGLDTVDYDEKGGIRFTGRATAGSPLRMYVDNAAVGDATADAAGRWVLTPPESVSPGVHTLRVDRLGPTGRVLARIELPFQRTSLPPADLAAGRIVVQPGQNLWRMARAAYGSGVRYTVIYLANREQIRDPARIYPGQAFSVPEAPR